MTDSDKAPDPIDELAEMFLSRLCELVAARLVTILESSQGAAPAPRDDAGSSDLTDEEIEALADQIIGEMAASGGSGPDTLPLVQIEI